MKTVPIVTDESESLCHQLNLLPVDEVPDAKREMHLHSTDTLCGNRQDCVQRAEQSYRVTIPHDGTQVHRSAATLRSSLLSALDQVPAVFGMAA